MQRVTIEFPSRLLGGLGFGAMQERIRRCEIVHILKYDAAHFTGIMRIEMNRSNASLMGLVGEGGATSIEVLSKSNGTYTCIMTCRMGDGNSGESRMFSDLLLGYDTILDLPIICTKERLVCTFVGKRGAVDGLVLNLHELGLDARVVKVQGLKVDLTPLISELTERQLEVLSVARRLGYFEIPRKVSSGDLARIFGISRVAVLEHLRKAERTIFNNLDGVL